MPTVLLPISPLAGFDRLRKIVRDDFRRVLDELEDFLSTLGIPLAPVATSVMTPMPVATAPQKRKRWHLAGTNSAPAQDRSQS